MAGPLNGIGGQQQFVSAGAYQQTQNNSSDIRQKEDAQPREDRVQARGNASAETQKSETRNNDRGSEDVSSRRTARDDSSSAREQRGSLVDITV